MVMFKGASLHVSEAARRTGISVRTILARLNRGWPDDRLFLAPDRRLKFTKPTGRPPKVPRS